MTEQEIDRLAQEYSDINYIKHINRYQPSFDGAKAEVSYESFKAGYQAAMEEIENLKKEVELLESCLKVYSTSSFEVNGQIFSIGSKAKDVLKKLKEMRETK